MFTKMPMIVSCSGSDCSYNSNSTCNAMAVTIGERREAVCDTYYRTDHKIAYPDTTSFVGACKMENCRFNRNLECTAYSGVSLLGTNGHVLCNTFQESTYASAESRSA